MTKDEKVLHGQYDTDLGLFELVTDASMRLAGTDDSLVVRRTLNRASAILGVAALLLVMADDKTQVSSTLVGDGLLLAAADAGRALDILRHRGWSIQIHSVSPRG